MDRRVTDSIERTRSLAEPTVPSHADINHQKSKSLTENGVTIVLTDVQPWCYETGYTTTPFLCATSSVECTKVATEDHNRHVCRPSDNVACYDFTAIMSGETTTSCFPELVGCNENRAYSLKDPDHRSVTECYVVRYKP